MSRGAPVQKFVRIPGWLLGELRKVRSTSKSIVLVEERFQTFDAQQP
jgi:hypothetical protein